MISKKMRKVLLVLVTFISACFYLIGNSIGDGIQVISGRKPAELRIKVNKKKSSLDRMYIDKNSKKIFYFFGNEGLINGDFVNVTEKPSDPSFISKTISKMSRDTNEIRVINRGESKNIKYSVKKGEIKNRVIVNYNQEPKSLYVEFYDRSKKLKKIVKNDYKEINIERLYGDFDESIQEIKVKFNELNSLENTLKDKVEVFSYGNGWESENLNYSIESVDGNEGILKIKVPNKSDFIYLGIFNEKTELKKLYSVKVRLVNLKSVDEEEPHTVWNAPTIDITTWDRKNIPVARGRGNTDITYGEDVLHGGVNVPYIDIKMGKISIPATSTSNKISITPTNSDRTAGHIILSNMKGEKISGRVYLVTESTTVKKPVKGINFEDIINSTSDVTFSDTEEKTVDVHMRVYDSDKDLKSLFIAGKLRYIKGFNSTFSIDIGDTLAVNKVERLPEVNILDLRDELKEHIKIKKNTLNLSEGIGENVGGDIVWDKTKEYVDIKLLEIKLDNFKDGTGNIKNSYIEIHTLNGKPDIVLQSGSVSIDPTRYYLKVKNGFTSDKDSVDHLERRVGYKRVGTISVDGEVGGIYGEVIVRVTKADFLSLKGSTTDTLEIKNKSLSGEKIDIVFNTDHLDKKLSIPYRPFKLLKEDSDRQNNEVKVEGTIFFNELKEKNLNLVFDSRKNSNGRIGVRGISQLINHNLTELEGNSVFNMTGEVISREYKDSDNLTLAAGEKGITNFVQTSAKPTIDGYKSATFKARNIDFELKIWNNTEKLELVAKKTGEVLEGDIVGIIEDRDENGNIQNKIMLNLYSSTRKIEMASDIMKVWRVYENSTEWNTEIEKINTITSSGNSPNISDEGGFTSLAEPFISYPGDTVTLEPIKGRGSQGIDGRAVKLSSFTATDKNLGTINNGKLTFDAAGKGSAKLELILTRGMIESFFPLDKKHIDTQEVQVAEIVFGKGKRRVPVTVNIQLAQPGLESDSTLPVRVSSEYIANKYYSTGVYEKTASVTIKDITSGTSRDIYTIAPGTITSGIIEDAGGSKNFKGKNLTTDIFAKVGEVGNLDEAGVYLKDPILSKTPEIFGVFTLSGGAKNIKEQEIWIPKYSPIKEMQSLLSDFQSDSFGEAKRYNKSMEFSRNDEGDSQTSLGVKKELGKIVVLGVSNDRVAEIKRNSKSLNKAKLPNKIKLIPKGIVAGSTIVGHLSFKEEEIVTEVEQKQGENQEYPIYLLISPSESNKLIPEEEYEVRGEYGAKRVSTGEMVTSNLLYYGLNTDNVNDLGLGEQIYEPIFNMNIRFKVNQRKLLKIDLADRAYKPLVKSVGLEKNMRFYKSDGKYTIDLIGPSNYANINVVGSIELYKSHIGNSTKSVTQTLRVTDLSNGRVVKGEIGETTGGVNLDTDLADLNIFYSNKSDLTIGMSAKNPMEVLNIGILKYKFKSGEIKLLLEHVDTTDSTNILSSNEVIIKMPKFYPKSWYLSENSFGKNSSKVSAPLKYFSENQLVFELGEVILKDIDRELMKDADDTEGIRVEYDRDIELEKSEDSTVKIKGKIVLLNAHGDKLPDENIITKGHLALVIDKTQSGYNLNNTYIYRSGDIGLSELKTNKPIRVGRNGYWTGLIEQIQINPVKTDESYSFLWNSGAVDISEWGRKSINRSFDINKSFIYGEESIQGGAKIPYIDIKMGDIFILKEDSANTIKLKNLTNVNKVGSVLLASKDGGTISGRLYLKAKTTGGEKPVKGYNNSSIPNSYSKIVFADNENKSTEVYLRVYDSEKNKKSLFKPEVLEYIENIYSTVGIEILSGNTIKKSDYSLPKVEFIDLRDTLKEKVSFNKMVLNFSEESGKNIGDNVAWVLGSRFVDIKLGNFVIENLVDKADKLKNPYVMIDTKDDIPEVSLDNNHEEIKPYRYYLKVKKGFVDEKDKINHANFGIGYSRVLSKSEKGKISEINGDIFMRISRDEFEKIKSKPEKNISLNKGDNTSAELSLIFNEDYPDRVVKVPYGEFKILKDEGDKENNSVTLNAFIYPKDMKEGILNLIFDSKKNITGNVGVRGTDSKIDDIHSEIIGYTVFDMTKGILQNQYKDSDTIEVASGIITNATNVEVTSAKFSTNGYKSVKFTGDNGIKYELKLWNNTDKIELTMDKTSMIGRSMKHKGIVELKTDDGKVLNRIELNMYVHMSDVRNSLTRTLRDGVHNGNLGVNKRYSNSNIWNTEVAVLEYGVSTTDRQVGIENNSAYQIGSYDGDRIYVEPTKGVGKEGIEGRWIELLSFTASIPQVGKVLNNRLELTAEGNGNARLKLTLPKEWIENRWPNNGAKGHDSFEGLELVYGNGKRRVPQKVINLQNGMYGLDGKIKREAYLTEEKNELNLGTLFNVESQVGLKAKAKGVSENSFTELGSITGVQEIGRKEIQITPLEFKGKQLKRMLTINVGGNSYGNLSINFKDIPLVKEETLIGEYTADRIRGRAEGLNYYDVYFPKYSPVKEVYSLSSSLRTNSDGSPSIVEQKLELTRDKVEDASSTQKIIKEIGNIGILGGDINSEQVIRRSSKALNTAKLPEKVYMIFENSIDLTNSIPVQLSFSADKLELEALQSRGVDLEKKIYLKIEKADAEKIVPNTRYKLVGNYGKNVISESEKIGEEILYLGIKTDNTEDLGLNEYIYDPIFKLVLVSEINQDKRVRLNLYQKGEELPIPKSTTGENKLMRVYLNEAKYSIDLVGHGNYGKLNMVGLQNPFEYDREEFKNPHRMRITDMISGKYVEGSIGAKGGYLALDGTLAKLNIGYSNRLSIKEGFTAKDSREILTIGLMKYKFKGGDAAILIEHFDGENTNPVISEELILRIPEFLPKEWYYSKESNLEKSTTAELKYFNRDELIFPIGDVGLNLYRDREITVDEDDSKGVRIEFDREIVLEDKNNASSKIKAKIVALKSNGKIDKEKVSIQEERVTLAIVIDSSLKEYDDKKTYIYRGGKMGVIEDELKGKPIRIGRNGYWESLIESIEIQPTKPNGLYLFDWESGIVDLTNWRKGVIPKSFDLTKDIQFGSEVSNGKVVPYIDIKMGSISIYYKEEANVISLEHSSSVARRGTVLLETQDGKKIVSKLYLKPDRRNTSTRVPVKGYDNNNILDSTLKVKFAKDEFKGADVHLRMYDSSLSDKTLFRDGTLKYIEGLYSNNRLFNIILEREDGTKNILKTDISMPNIEIINLKEKLEDKIRVDKKVLNFSLTDGQNIDEDISWVLGGKFVDIRLARVYLDQYLDKTMSIKNPYLEIETTILPSFTVGQSQENVYSYYLKQKTGIIKEEDKVVDGETGSTIGYKKVSGSSDDGNVTSIETDLMIRLTSEQYKKIKNSSEKAFTLNKENSISAEIKIIFNEDYPQKAVKVPYGEFKTLKNEQDKENHGVTLNTFIYPKEIKESQLNLIFDPLKNKTGNVGVRGTGSKIDDIHSELMGYTVFEMPKGILQNQYKDSDVIEVVNGITNTSDLIVTSSKFSVDGYKSVKFTGNNGIKYELKIWNNTNKIEITLDKTNLIGSSMKHKGVIELKTVDGNILNRIDLNMYVHMHEVKNALTRTLIEKVHNGNLGVRRSYTYSDRWNTEVEVVEYGVYTGDREVGIENNPIYQMKSYDNDKMYVEPTKGVGKEGIDGRWIEILDFKKSITQVGRVENNRLEFTPSGEGNARLRLTLPRSWVENRWPNNGAKGHDAFEGLELVYGNGKRRVPLRVINLQAETSGLDGKINQDIDLKEEGMELNLAIFVNKHNRIGLKAKVKNTMETDFTNLGVITTVQEVGIKDLPIESLRFRDKELRRSLVVNVGNNGYGNFLIKFKDVPLLKNKTLIGEYTADRTRGAEEGLGYYTVSFPKYSPVEEAYSLSASLSPNSDGSPKVNERSIEFYRENTEDRETTSEVIRELGNISLIGINTKNSDFLLRSSKNLNKAKLPNRIKLKRVENGIITKEVEGTLSFDIAKEVLEFDQKKLKDSDAKIYLNITKESAKNLDDNGVYTVEAEYDAGRISEEKVVTDNVVYLGLKTDNTADLGLNEYIYDPIFKLNLTASLVQDNSIKLSLFGNGDQKPIPKVVGVQKLVRLYKNIAQYSSDINPEEYGATVLKGYMNPYSYNRDDLKQNHILRVTDEITNAKGQAIISSTTGGEAHITTPLGIFRIGYNSAKSIGEGMDANHPLEVTTVGVKKYNFKRGDVRLLLEHLDPSNNTTPIYSETLIVGVPKFEPKAWYYNEANREKLTNVGTKYMKYFNGNKIIYTLGTVGLNQLRDREITKGADDSAGVRIEYQREVILEDRLDSSKKINAKIIKLDSSGNTLADGDIIESEVILGVEIDTNQVGYDSTKVYTLKGATSNVIESETENKPIRIGRKDHWESLVTNIQLRPVMRGDLTLNVTKNYHRNTILSFNNEGTVSRGSGVSLGVLGDFIKNIPVDGTIKIYKWGTESAPCGDLLAESTISSGELVTHLNINNKVGDKTNYKMKISKISNSGMELSIDYWGRDIFMEKMFIEVLDGNGATSIHRFGLNITEQTSMLQIDYVNAFDPGYEFAPGETITEAVGNSLYMGAILNPKSFKYSNQRPQLESVNSLKVSYIGEDIGLVNAIESIKLGQKGIELRDVATNKVIEIEDITFHKISKRYSDTSASSAFFEEIYKLKGYIDLKRYLDLSNGHYRGTVKIEINLN